MTMSYQRPFYDDHPTPYIEVDEIRLMRNLQQMQRRASEAGVKLRPHVKTHKSVEIALRQLALGAQGITVAKPSEAQVFLRGGVRDILLAFPIVRPDTLIPLLRDVENVQARLSLIVDSLLSVKAIAEARQHYPSCRVTVWIKVDVGLHRIGVSPHSDEALQLVRALQHYGLPFGGLLSHPGQAYAAGEPAAIAVIAEEEQTLMQQLRQRLQEAGSGECALSVGSTPTLLAAPPGKVDEVRPGNYALLDLTAVRLGLCTPDALALSVVTRVVATQPHAIIVDAGSKMLSSDRGPHGTQAKGFGIAVSHLTQQLHEVEKLSEEHGFVAHTGEVPPVGSLMRIFPNHSCAVMAMSDSFLLRQPQGEARVMPVDARGMVT